jgi:aryl-alcohol dehydrogenase-like predicted oxidoreductase/enamine deaminase RidA (YjgF/YER057c/UK114 family)
MVELGQVQLGSVSVRPILTGLWQMADQERDGKPFDLDGAAEALVGYARDGFDSFDMADHYGSAEIVAGMAHRALVAAGDPAPTILTKWCPPPGPMDAGTVRRGVEERLERLGLDCVDVLQFHWWRYASPEYIDALEQMMRLREEGLIREIGLTNFDTGHLRLLLRHGIEIVSNQVCFSLLDRRAAGEMSALCRETGVRLLAFGTLCGGFLSARWVGQPEPADIPDWSGMKYKRVIDVAGGWAPFQKLMGTLEGIARKHGVSVSNVASRWVLDHAAVAGTIVGARLGEREHRADNMRVLGLGLDEADRAAISGALTGLAMVPGDCGDEYRKPPFLTASGDLSHHLDTLPPVHAVHPVPARPERTRSDSGSPWEAAAGFSRGVRVGNRILVSGTTATDPHGNCVCPGDPEGQALYTLDKIIATVVSLGGKAEDIVRTRIYMKDPERWEGVGKVHAHVFGDVLPANTLIGISSLVGPYEIEIEAEAEVDPQG